MQTALHILAGLVIGVVAGYALPSAAIPTAERATHERELQQASFRTIKGVVESFEPGAHTLIMRRINPYESASTYTVRIAVPSSTPIRAWTWHIDATGAATSWGWHTSMPKLTPGADAFVTLNADRYPNLVAESINHRITDLDKQNGTEPATGVERIYHGTISRIDTADRAIIVESADEYRPAQTTQKRITVPKDARIITVSADVRTDRIHTLGKPKQTAWEALSIGDEIAFSYRLAGGKWETRCLYLDPPFTPSGGNICGAQE